MPCTRHLYAYLDPNNQVLGGAPFDGCTREEAEREVRLTFGGLCDGCKVVKATPPLIAAYRKLEDSIGERLWTTSSKIYDY